MVKVKELVKKAKIALHGKKAKVAQKFLEDKMEEIEQTKVILKKLKIELKEIEEMDISEFDVKNYEY